MSSLEIGDTKNASESSKDQNAEQVVTVFDLASEIEKSLKDVMHQVLENDKEFQERFQSIEEKLKAMESQSTSSDYS
ncbi:LAFE_0A03576g1_1 [Lachancea fermentati]|uniref:LAFE_0A03576g1_1 n=1 Tax=Lachancea fermentati TaxID=4955 RepID=A0A1G4M6I9_LACFM|nr:LAFE_0A03576g1_1 [Lachancea fermentati]